MISKAAVGIAVGIAGIFVGYCFYFDQKRRSDPDFKKKLRERKSSYSVVFPNHVIHSLFMLFMILYKKTLIIFVNYFNNKLFIKIIHYFQKNIFFYFIKFHIIVNILESLINIL